MAICEKCGHSNDDNVKFCGGCGARMDVRRSTPPPLVFDLEPDEESPKQPKREHRGSVPPPYEPRPASQSSEPKPKSKYVERSSTPGSLSRGCMLKGCLVLLVAFLVCGGIMAYLFYQDDEKESRGILDSIETPEDTINIVGVSGVSLSKDSEASEENGEETLPIGKEYINRELNTKIGFAKSESSSEPVYVVYFSTDDTKGHDIVKISPSGKGHFTLYKSDGMTPDAELYIYPGAEKVRISSKGVEVIFQSAESFSEAVSSTDPSYTPARYAITAGSDKGKWETLQSGETVYIYPSGTYAHSIWIKDGGKYYYVDASGCLMKDNYAHDGFYAGADGAWNKEVKCIDVNKLPGKSYTDRNTQKWNFDVKEHSDGTITGTAQHIYRGTINLTENYVVKAFGHSAYSLTKKDDEFVRCHVVVLDNGHTILVSSVGATNKFILN